MVRPTVLIVDDHEGFRVAARALLEAEGFAVVGEAADGRDALTEVERLRPDVVLLDIQLPDIDGFSVATRLATAASPPDVVLVSSREADTYGLRLANAPARGYLAKRDLSGAALAHPSPDRPWRVARLVLVSGGLALGLARERAAFGWDDPRRWIPDLVVGLTFIGAAAATVPGGQGTGWLLAATGFAWFAGNIDDTLLFLHRGPLVHALVVFVGWRVRTAVELVTVVVGYGAAVVALVWRNDVAAVVLAVAFVGVAAYRWVSDGHRQLAAATPRPPRWNGDVQIIDGPAPVADSTLLVVRNCYLAVRKAATAAWVGQPPDHVVVIREPGGDHTPRRRGRRGPTADGRHDHPGRSRRGPQRRRRPLARLRLPRSLDPLRALSPGADRPSLGAIDPAIDPPVRAALARVDGTTPRRADTGGLHR